MMDLFALAEANSANLSLEYTNLLGSLSSAILKTFSEYVNEHGKLSLNVRPFVLSELLSKGDYQNIHEWSEEMSRLSGKPRNEILREKLGHFGVLRTTFDSAFDDGQLFRYAALNIGGLGATIYGQFCVVFRESFHITSRSALI